MHAVVATVGQSSRKPAQLMLPGQLGIRIDTRDAHASLGQLGGEGQARPAHIPSIATSQGSALLATSRFVGEGYTNCIRRPQGTCPLIPNSFGNG